MLTQPMPNCHRFILISTKFMCLVMLMGGGCIDGLLLHPDQKPVTTVDHAQDRILVERNQKVEVYVTRSIALADGAAPAGYVLEFTGNASCARDVLTESRSRWSKLPVEIWVMNYPGFGKSDGPTTLKSVLWIALATYDELGRQAGRKPIFLAGRSFGTTVALYVGTQRHPAGLILESCPPLPQIMQGEYGWWNLWILSTLGELQIPSEFDSLKSAAKSHAPALFLITGRDTIVPLKYQRMVQDIYAGPKQTVEMPLSQHNVDLSPDQMEDFHQKLDLLWQKCSNH